MKKLHLICNAHIDPVWLWEIEEGMGEAISTFRIAADFCDEYNGFVFNHNEALLYEWVEKHAPDLFLRIKKLVVEGKWHIMGGWYLQPDCNMPSGESLVRQIITGRKYFENRFGKLPKTAINFDPFGHSRGLVQILTKSGFNSYIYTRPRENDSLSVPGDDFIWEGFDGSEIIAHRAFEGYQTHSPGWAAEKIKRFIQIRENFDSGLILWGIGNHGGGPSRRDLEEINEIIFESENKNYMVTHSTPESYFEELSTNELEIFSGSLNPWAPGCYTSQMDIKKKYRNLENMYYFTEKISSHSAIKNLCPYPSDALKVALKELLIAQFHDTLPGTSIKTAKDFSISKMDHAIVILKDLIFERVYKEICYQPLPDENVIPVYVYNPHPYFSEQIIEFEISPHEVRRDGKVYGVEIFCDSEKIESQIEREESNLSVDWRKKISLKARLKPSGLTRFDCHISVIDKIDKIYRNTDSEYFLFSNNDCIVKINRSTGLIDKYIVDGYEYISEQAFLPIVINDNEDPWGSHVKKFTDVAGKFRLATQEEAASISGIRGNSLDSVRIIEQGCVRTIVESIFIYNNSYLISRYIIPAKGTQIELSVRVFWCEKSKMLKLSLPVNMSDSTFMGETAYGIDTFQQNGSESVFQRWCGLFSENSSVAFTVVNDCIYGADFRDGTLNLSLLRSGAYSALMPPHDTTVPQDRFIERIDQGQHDFKFYINAGEFSQRRYEISKESQSLNELPYIIPIFPIGGDYKPNNLFEIKGQGVALSALKLSENNSGYIIRLFNSLENKNNIVFSDNISGFENQIKFSGYEIKTFIYVPEDKKLIETDLLENLTL